MKARVYEKLKDCPGKRHAWFASSVGKIRKPIATEMDRNFQICSRCVMDTTAPEINFDRNGVCNFCRIAQSELESIKRLPPPVFPKGKKYDAVIGLSGGADSSYALYQAVTKYNLRVLAFSVDNGWNTPVADENIMKLVEGMKVPFIRYTIDLDRFKDLQSSFIKAGVKNIEIPTDHVLMAATYELANRYGVKTILSGGNVASESIMPASWGYNARDLVHIKDIYRKMTGRRLKGLPLCGLLKWNWYKWVKKIRMVYLLDHLDYHRQKAIDELTEKFGYKDYGDKHTESEFTKWFQNYYLFEKFGIDKRKAHYSSLINAGQLTRESAQESLYEAPLYPKLGIEDAVLSYPKREHDEFRKDEKRYLLISKIVKWLR